MIQKVEKKIIIILILFSLIILLGCAHNEKMNVQQNTSKTNYEPNQIQNDSKNINKESNSENKTDVQDKEQTHQTETQSDSENEDEKKNSLNRKSEAEQTAKVFVQSWQNKQYNIIYAMLTSELKAKKTQEEFSAIMDLEPLYKRLKTVTYKGIIMEDDSAKLSITVDTNVQSIDITNIRLELDDNNWKVHAFSEDIFGLTALDAACSGYINNNGYTYEDCIHDFAIKIKNSEYCNLSKCSYLDCMQKTNVKMTRKHEAEQCKLCPPFQLNEKQCIRDVAIKYNDLNVCDEISDTLYVDKYCTCYGGFAKEKGSSAYCNIISDSDNKELCLKGAEGKNC